MGTTLVIDQILRDNIGNEREFIITGYANLKGLLHKVDRKNRIACFTEIRTEATAGCNTCERAINLFL